jgi:uncharacterized protein YegL
MIEEQFDEDLETILSELETITELVKRPSENRPLNQRAFIEWLTQRIAVKLISFRSVSHPLFQEIVQCANSDFSWPVYTTLKHHIKRLAEVHRQLTECQEKSYCSLMVDGAKPFGRCLLAVTTFMEEHVRFVDFEGSQDERAITIASSLVTVISA